MKASQPQPPVRGETPGNKSPLPVPAKVSRQPFAPALETACGLLAQNFQQQLNTLFAGEAKALQLPEGWQVDMQKRHWILPEAKSD